MTLTSLGGKENKSVCLTRVLVSVCFCGILYKVVSCEGVWFTWGAGWDLDLCAWDAGCVSLHLHRVALHIRSWCLDSTGYWFKMLPLLSKGSTCLCLSRYKWTCWWLAQLCDVSDEFAFLWLWEFWMLWVKRLFLGRTLWIFIALFADSSGAITDFFSTQMRLVLYQNINSLNIHILSFFNSVYLFILFPLFFKISS